MCCRVVPLDKKLYTILPLSTQVYNSLLPRLPPGVLCLRRVGFITGERQKMLGVASYPKGGGGSGRVVLFSVASSYRDKVNSGRSGHPGPKCDFYIFLNLGCDYFRI